MSIKYSFIDILAIMTFPVIQVIIKIQLKQYVEILLNYYLVKLTKNT